MPIAKLYTLGQAESERIVKMTQLLIYAKVCPKTFENEMHVKG